MKTTLTARPLSAQTKDALIIFVQNKKPLTGGDKPLADRLARQIKSTGFSGDSMQTLTFPSFGIYAATGGKIKAPAVILAGLGKRSAFSMETLERSAAAAVRAGIKAGAKSFATPVAVGIAKTDDAAFAHAVARGAAWGTYSFRTFKTPAKKAAACSLTFAGKSKNTAAVQRALPEAEAESAALLSTADLANSPGNVATPQKIANWASKMAKETGLTCSVLGKTELKKEKCNALLAVAAGSRLDAKMITLKYKGTDPKARPIVLVGKTITFDSGGISLNPGKNMGWMLYDKCGGMAVLTAMQMIARLKPKQPVIGILAAAENMPGGDATRPGDIIKSRSGKTIEILNTDAEGRLALCDALDLGLKYKPAAIVDLATLTGAVIVALGHSGSAVMGNNSRLTQKLIKSATAGGERLWELPIWDEHKEDMKGTFADLQNIGKSGAAGTITAGAFLREFVPDDIPWAHLDIAGTAWVESEKPWMAPGATLFGARTLVEWIKAI